MAHLPGCNGGKGSARRQGADQKAYADNWDLIFGKKEPEVVEKNADTPDEDAASEL